MDFHTLKKFNKKATGGKRFLNLLITEAYRKKLSAYLKKELKARMRRRAFEDRAANLKDLAGSIMDHITPVTQPLVLIFDLPLPGETLLHQLFDGHPQLHVHPGDIKLAIDEQKKSISTGSDPINNPKQWFGLLAQDSIEQHVEKVYRNLEMIGSSQPFVFIPYLQERIFLRYLKSMDSRDLRTVYNAYMTSYFGSWLNYANLNGPDRKYIVGLSKTPAMHQQRAKHFFDVYPEGKLVFILRNPKIWLGATSARREKKYPNVQSAVNQWREITVAMMQNKEAFGDNMCIVRHEDLADNTEAAMHHLCKFLDIEFDRILLTPTFNGSGMKSLYYPATAKAARNNFLLHSDQPQFEGIDVDWNQTLDEYEAILGKTIQF
jgi:hypothetical protein